MTRDQIAYVVHQLGQAHTYDGDGGYALVDGILQFAHQIDDRRKLREYLIHLVAEEQAGLWGVALEALVQESSPETPAALEELLRSGRGTQLWNYQLTSALLRLGYDKAIDVYVPYIQYTLDQDRPVCPLLVQLFGVAPDISIAMSAQFFAKHLLSEKRVSEAVSCVPTLIYHYTKKDEEGLLQLVEQTSSLSNEAGEKLKHLISSHLSKPWAASELGQERLAKLRRAFAVL